MYARGSPLEDAVPLHGQTAEADHAGHDRFFLGERSGLL